jgi:hypothetical protein
MIDDPIAQLLLNAGFTEGWAVADGVLILWEHHEEPPAPLVRPDEAPTTVSNPAE